MKSRRNNILLVFIMMLSLFVFGYQNNNWSNTVEYTKKGSCKSLGDKCKIYLLPDDDSIEKMDNDTLYLIFDKYVHIHQFHCCSISRQGPWSDSGKYICEDSPFKQSSQCVVYSFGSRLDFAFEDAIWKSFKCEIHTFDPSISITKSSRIPSFINYHLIGLSGRDFVQTEPEIWRHHDRHVRKTWEMQRLSTILRSLSHTNKIIDILKIDIEGWEWDALPNMLQTGAVRNVKQLCIEIHFGFSFKEVIVNGTKMPHPLFTKNTWGNISIKNQIKILRQLYIAGFRITMYSTVEYGSITVKSRKISTLYELTLINLNLLNN